MKLLLPIAYLNEACFLSLNVDDKKYKMSLKISQDTLKQILGPEFYDEIEDQYNPNSDTLTPDNSTLYENYIKDFLAWETYFNYLRFAQSDSTPTGIREFSDENSTLLSDIKLSGLEKNVKAQSKFYKDTMINFLVIEQSKDSTKYPKYNHICSDEMYWGISGINAKSDATFKVNKTVISNE